MDMAMCVPMLNDALSSSWGFGEATVSASLKRSEGGVNTSVGQWLENQGKVLEVGLWF